MKQAQPFSSSAGGPGASVQPTSRFHCRVASLYCCARRPMSAPLWRRSPSLGRFGDAGLFSLRSIEDSFRRFFSDAMIADSDLQPPAKESLTERADTFRGGEVRASRETRSYGTLLGASRDNSGSAGPRQTMDYEKLGLFYLGKTYDMQERKVQPNLLLYESKDLTTHAVCLGMTGSGKTGLGIALLEEAAIDGIPVIAIDPKGDMGNLLLGFPELRPEDFRPWVDPDEAGRRGLTVDQFAAKTADQWREGLASWDQDGARIARLRDAVDMAIYTPGSSAGLPLTVLRSFEAPPPALVNQAEAYRERVGSAVSGLLALLGIVVEPISSREHILLANVLDHSWRAGKNLDMAGLIHAVQSPPFEKVGVMDVETFFPAKDRFGLAMKLNNLLASPSFAAWMEGEPLDVGGLLHTREGKPRLSIMSIAHLSDNERMFFVTILLNEVLAWVRTQPGTSSLRAILYMDEIFGYFPPTANPPSKVPMLTLLKQARAFGVGVVLATQNPVDLDYKGLSNAGTWFLGRLQTQRDKDRVLEGLEGASTAAGHAFNRKKMDEILSGLGNRVFVMNNVHNDQPVVFQTRWALSYLRGPLTREQIQTLMATRKQIPAACAAGSCRSRCGCPFGFRSPILGFRRRSPGCAARRARFLRAPARFAEGRGVVALSPRDPGRGPAPLRRQEEPAWTTGKPWHWSSGSTMKCRRRSGVKASRSTTTFQSWTRHPRPVLASRPCLPSWLEARVTPSGPNP